MKHWHTFKIDYAPNEHWAWKIEDKEFTGTGQILNFLRKEMPEFEWKSVRYGEAYRDAIEIKYRIKEKNLMKDMNKIWKTKYPHYSPKEAYELIMRELQEEEE